MSGQPVTLKQIVAEYEAALKLAERYEVTDAPTPAEQGAELARLDREAEEDEAFERRMERECDRAPGCPCRGCRP